MQHRKLRPHGCSYRTEGSTILWILDSQEKPWARTNKKWRTTLGSAITIYRRITRSRCIFLNSDSWGDPKHGVVEERTFSWWDTILWQKIPRVRKVSSVPNQEETIRCSLSIRKTPNCEVCKKTKPTRARCRIKPEKRVDGIAPSTKFGDLITVDHKILNVENGSRCGHKKML